MGASWPAVVGLRRVIPSTFSHRVEEHLTLRLMALAIGLWVALSLAWVGGPGWIWGAGVALMTVGHAFSWLFRALRSPVRTAVVGIAVAGTLALIPRTVVLASTGDWLPIAHFLLLFQGIASFELRSRAALYTTVGMSGVILFLVSQRAPDASFGVFLTGFTALLLSFLAISSLVDQLRNTEVRWFRSRLSFAWFLTGLFAVLMLASAGVFVLMPKHLGSQTEHAEAAVLPIRGSAPASPSIMARMPSVPALRRSDVDWSLASPNEGAESPRPTTSAGEGDGRPTGAEVAARATIASDSGASISTDRGSERPAASDERGRSARSVVMRVRNPVLTYWRGQVFDGFDGSVWRPDPTSWAIHSRGRANDIYKASTPGGLRPEPLYAQTYFIEEPPPRGVIYSGYSPLIASVPRSSAQVPGLGDGTIYKVLSALPDFATGSLERGRPRPSLDSRYRRIPTALDGLRGVAQQISGDAYTDLDRARRIVTFLDANYEFNGAAADQLALSSDPLEFLSRWLRGTSMDFATAAVTLSRAAGVPARLVTGYLPGEFDPLSGTYAVTYAVRNGDGHAWAEMYIVGIGWVPFDAAPSPAVAALGEGETYRSKLLSSLFSMNYGEDVYGAFRSSPQSLAQLLRQPFGGEGLGAVAGLALGIVAATAGVFVARRLLKVFLQRRRRPGYSHLAGEGRQEILRLYIQAEKLLRRAGFGRRSPSQTLGEYAGPSEALARGPCFRPRAAASRGLGRRIRPRALRPGPAVGGQGMAGSRQSYRRVEATPRQMTLSEPTMCSSPNAR